LSFNPPPASNSSLMNILPPNPNRTPSPLIPPAPPFAQSPPAAANLERPGAGGLGYGIPPGPGAFRPNGSRTDLRSVSAGDVPLPSSPATSLNAGLTRPGLNIGSSVSPSPSMSSNYGTPLEYPRTGSPLGSGLGAAPAAPRTISAAAFKRPQMRTTSSGHGPDSPVSPNSGRPTPDVSPLSLRKKVPALPSTPYPQQQNRDTSPPGGRSAYPTYGSEPGHGDGIDQYDVMSSYHGENSPTRSAGYGQGKFATNLEDER